MRRKHAVTTLRAPQQGLSGRKSRMPSTALKKAARRMYADGYQDARVVLERIARMPHSVGEGVHVWMSDDDCPVCLANMALVFTPRATTGAKRHANWWPYLWVVVAVVTTLFVGWVTGRTYLTPKPVSACVNEFQLAAPLPMFESWESQLEKVEIKGCDAHLQSQLRDVALLGSRAGLIEGARYGEQSRDIRWLAAIREICADPELPLDVAFGILRRPSNAEITQVRNYVGSTCGYLVERIERDQRNNFK